MDNGDGQRWSSSVTGDIRIIWDYDNENRLIILLLESVSC